MKTDDSPSPDPEPQVLGNENQREFSQQLTDTGQSVRGGVLCYHAIGEPSGDSYNRTISPARFRQDIAALLADGFEIVDLPEVIEGRPASQGKVALTFDDGYVSFYETVVPILEEFEIPATVYVISDKLGKGDFMGAEKIAQFVDNEFVTIGNHTRTHPHLPELEDLQEIKTEITGAKNDLETQFGIDIDRFCYPFYEYDDRSAEIVGKEHNSGVVGYLNHPLIGTSWQDDNPAIVPRIDGITFSILYNWMGPACLDLIR